MIINTQLYVLQHHLAENNKLLGKSDKKNSEVISPLVTKYLQLGT